MTTDDSNAVPVAKPAAPVEPAGFEVVVDVTEQMELQLLRIQMRPLLFWLTFSFVASVGLGVWELVARKGGLPFMEFTIAGLVVWFFVHALTSARTKIHTRHARFGDVRVQLRFGMWGVESYDYRLQSGKAGDCTGFEKRAWPEFVQAAMKPEFWLLYPNHVTHIVLPTAQLTAEQQAFIDGCIRSHGVKVIR